MNRSSTARPVRRALAAAAVTTLLAGGLAACGDKGGTDAPAAGSSSSAAAGAAGGTAAPAAAYEAGEKLTPAELTTLLQDGLEASTTAHTTMQMEMGPMGKLTGSGQVDFTQDPAEMAVTMRVPAAGDTTMEVRLVDGLFYLSMGQLTGGKFWKVDPDDPSGPLGGSGLGSMMRQMAPGQMLAGLEDGIRDVTYVGQEDVSDRQLDHYRVTVDTAAMTRAMGEAMRGQAMPSAGAMPKTLTYDLWLDDQDRLGRMDMKVPMGGNDISLRVEMTDWGAPVHIVAPPADQVTDPSRISG